MAFCPPGVGDTAGNLLLVTGLDAARRADLVIVERATRLNEATDKQCVLSLLYITGLGKLVLTRMAWLALRCRVTKLSRVSFIHHTALIRSTCGRRLSLIHI